MTEQRKYIWWIALVKWLLEPKALWIGIIAIVVAIVPGCWYGTESSVRIPGYILQLLGMACTIRGLLGIRAHFKHPPFWQLFIVWQKRRPKRRREVKIDVGTGRYNLEGGQVDLVRWSPDEPQLPIEQRLNRLVSNVEELRLRGQEQTTMVNDLRQAVQNQYGTLVNRTEQVERNIQSNLESLHTTNLFMSLVGLVWITTGITMTTFAPELYAVLHRD